MSILRVNRVPGFPRSPHLQTVYSLPSSTAWVTLKTHSSFSSIICQSSHNKCRIKILMSQKAETHSYAKQNMMVCETRHSLVKHKPFFFALLHDNYPLYFLRIKTEAMNNLFSPSRERSIISKCRPHMHTEVGGMKSPDKEEVGLPRLPGNKESDRRERGWESSMPKTSSRPLFYHRSSFIYIRFCSS